MVPGVNGVVWVDANRNGLRDVGEYGEAGWTVTAQGPNGETLNFRRGIEPDNFPDGQLLPNFSPLVTLAAIGSDSDGKVGAFTDTANSTGTKNFRAFSRAAQSYLSTWNATTRRLQINFTSPTSVVEIDAIGAAMTSYGRLEVYNAAGQLLGRYTTSALADSAVETMRIARGTADIAYAIASGHSVGTVRLDNLQFGAKATTVTGSKGEYSLPSLPAGTYRIQVSSSFAAPLNPSSGRQSATVAANTATRDIDFGFVTSVGNSWQNPVNRFDVSNDGVVSPLDALLVINELSARGSRSLVGSTLQRPPWVDVSGDVAVSPLDALLVINRLNAIRSGNGGSGNGGGGEGERSVGSDGGGADNSPLKGEGESSDAAPFVGPIAPTTGSVVVSSSSQARSSPAGSIVWGEDSESEDRKRKAETEDSDQFEQLISLLASSHFKRRV